MDNKPLVINLPFGETVRRSFMYVLTKPGLYLKISGIWFALLIYELLCGFPSACNFHPETCTGEWRQNVSVLLLTIASIGIVISYSREVVLKTSLNYFSLNFLKLGVIYLFYKLLFVLLITVPSIVAIFIFAFIGQMLNFSEPVCIVALIFPLMFIIYFSRVLLVFPAVSVGDFKLDFKQSFKMTLGNANKIFWGQFLMTTPVIVALVALTLAYRAFPNPGIAVNFIFVGLLYALSFVDSCLKASFFGHIYQYFTFYDKHTPKPVLEIE